MAETLARFLAFARTEDGQTLVEYALILSLVSIVTIAILIGLGQGVVQVFTSAASAL
jgi:Flp pilus assembly pilin Flp